MIMEEKGKKKRKVKYNSQKAEDEKKSDLELLEGLIRKFFEKLEKSGFEPKAQDVIRAIQLKQKLAQASEKEKIFWGMIQELREEGLGKKMMNKKCPPSTVSHPTPDQEMGNMNRMTDDE
jgi:hypothetical protein